METLCFIEGNKVFLFEKQVVSIRGTYSETLSPSIVYAV